MAKHLQWNSGTGHLLYNNSTGPKHLATSCGGDGPCPAVFDQGSIATSYTFAHSFSASGCVDCSVDGTDPAFDGTVTQVTVGIGLWRASNVAIDGVGPSTASIQYTGIEGNCWVVDVECDSGIIWTGAKASGSTPAGTYIRGSGCDMTPTISVS